MNEFQELLEDYRRQGAPGDQQMLIYLLREVQELCGGTLSEAVLHEIAAAYNLKSTMLPALIRRIPSLRMESAPHLLEMCATCPKGRELRAWVEKTWGVASGQSAAGFTYRTTPCMKNCRSGPSIRWDGVLYSNADRKLISRLIEQQG